MVVSYRFSIVTIALPITIRPQFAVECLLRLNQQGWVIFEPNLGRKGLTDVNQILTRSRRDMVHRCSRTRKKYCQYLLPCEHNARTWQTDRQTTERLALMSP